MHQPLLKARLPSNRPYAPEQSTPSPPLSSKSRTALILLWSIALLSIPIWIAHDHVGWDLAIYRNALHALRLGHDPYLQKISIGTNPKTFRYIYPPLTLPLLRLAGMFPNLFAKSLYWLLYALSLFSIVSTGLRCAQPSERTILLYLAPAALFLPGLLHHDAILSGNIVFPLYALVLSTALLGWNRNRWLACYLAILFASFFKLPLLTLLAIPLLSARRQAIPTTIAAAIGVALFVVQPLLWPTLFHHFLQAVQLQFTYNQDFGCSPAGVLSQLLITHGIPYSPAGTLIYLAYALPLFALLLHLSHQFLAHRFTLRQWLPILLTGVVLLNPRIMQYDVVLLTLPMLLIGWRYLRRLYSLVQTVLALCIFLATANLFAVQEIPLWKLTEAAVLALFFAAGAWNLLHRTPRTL